MNYHSTAHAVDRLTERTAGAKVFDPRSRRFVEVANLELQEKHSLMLSHLYRSHLLPPDGWKLFREINHRMYNLMQDTRVVRFDDYVYILKPHKRQDAWVAVTMMLLTQEQADIINISTYELYVVLQQNVLVSLVSQMNERGLTRKAYELEDAVRRAIHFGAHTTCERVKNIIGEEDALRLSAPCQWFAGPLQWSWNSDESSDQTLVVGVQYSREFTQVRYAKILDRAFDSQTWVDDDHQVRILSEAQVGLDDEQEEGQAIKRVETTPLTIPLPIDGARMLVGRLDRALTFMIESSSARKRFMTRSAKRLREIPIGAARKIFGQSVAASYFHSMPEAKLFAAPVAIRRAASTKTLVLLARPCRDGGSWRCKRAILTQYDISALLDDQSRALEGESVLVPIGHGDSRVDAYQLASLLGGIGGKSPDRLVAYLRLCRDRISPLSPWGLYELLTFADEERCDGCALELDGESPIGSGTLAIGFELRGHAWTFTRARVVKQALLQTHLLVQKDNLAS